MDNQFLDWSDTLADMWEDDLININDNLNHNYDPDALIGLMIRAIVHYVLMRVTNFIGTIPRRRFK